MNSDFVGGTVKRLVKDRGFGFIVGSDGVERFFHHSSLKNVRFEALTEGAEVRFIPAIESGNSKGPRTDWVEKA